MEAHSVPMASGLREVTKHLHISMLTEAGGGGQRGHTYSSGADGPRTGRMLPSHTSSPNSDGLYNAQMQ